MIKVLIAEDELPLLRGIKVMIERINPNFVVVKCAQNGKEALSYLEENPVDVIFTDINMPLIDGIEVLKFAAEKYPECLKIVISGYGEFQYAQQAIRYGVMEYLLKPIVKEDLVKIMNIIWDTVQSKRKKQQKDLLKSVIYEGNKGVGTQKVQMIYFCAGPLMKEGMEESVEECRFWKDSNIEDVALPLLPRESSIYAFEKNQPNERILLIVSQEEVDLEKFCNNILEEMESKGICLSAVYHQERIEMQQIPAMGYQLRRLLQNRILIGESSFSEDIETPEEQLKTFDISFPSELIGRERLVLKEVERVLSRDQLRQKDCIYLLEQLLSHTLLEKESEHGENEEIVLNLILYSEDKQQLFDNIKQILSKKGMNDNQETTKYLMEKIQEYVHKHMSEAITVTSLAERFGLVPPYLSRLFKEYSGYTLSQYIQKTRIDRAKELLDMDDDILVKDVAEIVGYSEPLYFSKIFKKKVGLYPSEYRKKEMK
ncbi:MAG TPA: response regulator [Candidatus Merdenecus merdavium]|nr:response regulator [Candidatus Merdenecus merdavium]